MRCAALLAALLGGVGCDLDERPNVYGAAGPAPQTLVPGRLVLLSSPVDGRMPRLVVSIDADGDGRLDLLLGRVDGGASPSPCVIDLHRGLAGGGFESVPSGSVEVDPWAGALAAADLNGDGAADLLVGVLTDASGGRIDVLLGAGDGSFGAPTPGATGLDVLRLAVGDFNGDGVPDVVAGGSAETWVLPNDGSGAFGAPAVFAYPAFFAAIDVDGDGEHELAIVEEVAGTWVEILGHVLTTGDLLSTLALPAGQEGTSLAVADANGDGHPDVAVGTGDAVATDVGRVLIFPGDGTGHFGAPLDADVGVNVGSLAAVDYDGDGLSDFAAVGAGAVDTVFLVSGSGRVASWAVAADDPGSLVATGVGGVAWGDAAGFHLLTGGDLLQAPQ
jgi:hypothetical protein